MSTADPRYTGPATAVYAEQRWPYAVPEQPSGPALGLVGPPPAPVGPPPAPVGSPAPVGPPPGPVGSPDLVGPPPGPVGPERDRRGVRRIGRELLHAARGSASREIRDQVELAARLQRTVAAPRRVVVAGTRGGVGSATTAGLICLALAHHRRDRVVLVDGHPGPVRTLGQLGVGGGWSLGEVAGMERPPARFDEVRQHFAATHNGLYAMSAVDGHPARDRLDPATYEAGVAALNRYFAVTVFGCGSAPTYEVVAGAHALVLVTSATVDGAADLRRRLIWLYAQGLSAVVARTIAVFVARAPGRGIDLRAESAALAEMGVGTARLPFDRRLAAAAALAPNLVTDATRSAAVTIAAEALTRATSWA